MTLHWITTRFYGTWQRRGGSRFYVNEAKHRPFYASKETGRIMEAEIADICVVQGWPLFDCVAMESHLHTAFGSHTAQPDGAIVGRFKSRITRTLRQQGRLGPTSRMWSKDNTHYDRLPMSELPRVMAYCVKNRRERRW